MKILNGIRVMFVLMLVISFAKMAYAEAVQGRVVSVDSAGNSVTIQPTQGQTTGLNQTGNMEFRLNDQSQMQGVSSLDELQVGDEISVQGSQTAGTWEATSLERRAGAQDTWVSNVTTGGEQPGIEQSDLQQEGTFDYTEDAAGMGSAATGTTGGDSSDFGMEEQVGTENQTGSLAGDTSTAGVGQPMQTGTPGVVDQNI